MIISSQILDPKCELILPKGLFDVQESTANKIYPGTVNVSCVFANNSQALGCLVVLHPQTATQTEMFAYAARSGDSDTDLVTSISIPGVPKGSYIVLVFDGEENGLISVQAAVVQNVTVTEGEPTRGNKLLSGNKV